MSCSDGSTFKKTEGNSLNYSTDASRRPPSMGPYTSETAAQTACCGTTWCKGYISQKGVNPPTYQLSDGRTRTDDVFNSTSRFTPTPAPVSCTDGSTFKKTEGLSLTYSMKYIDLSYTSESAAQTACCQADWCKGYISQKGVNPPKYQLSEGKTRGDSIFNSMSKTPTPPHPDNCTVELCKKPENCPRGNVCIGNNKQSNDADYPGGFFFIDNYTNPGSPKELNVTATGTSIGLSQGASVDKTHVTSVCTVCPTGPTGITYANNRAQNKDDTVQYKGDPSYTLSSPLCLASTTKIPKVVKGTIQYVEVKDLKDGDMIRTTRGDYPLSHIMHTTTVGPHTYVKVEQGSLGNNLPSQDLYITHEHSFSLGYYKNSVLNRNIHDSAQDDMVYLHITADQLADKLPGITRVQKEFDSMFNLVFDEHVSLDIYGLEVMMHHPKGNPYTLPQEKYQDKTKFNNKVQKPLFAHYGMLENVKPNHMEMKDFLRNCITANLEEKFRLEDVNHPSFVPPKTMLSEDMREKLRVA